MDTTDVNTERTEPYMLYGRKHKCSIYIND